MISTPPRLFYHGFSHIRLQFDASSCKRGILGRPKNVPEFSFYNYCNSFGNTFWPNHTLIFSKSNAPPKEFPFHIVDEKKKSSNLGYSLARLRIFRDLSKKAHLSTL